MSEKKSGFFRRLFRRGGKEKAAEAPQPEAEAPAAAPAAGTPEPTPETIPEALREPAPPQEGPPPPAPAPEEDTAPPQPAQAQAKAEEQAAPEAETPPPPAREKEKTGWLARLRRGLSKSSSALGGGISGIFTRRRLDEETLQELEDILIQADLGIDMAERIIERLRKERFEKDITPQQVKAILAEEVSAVLAPVEKPFEIGDNRPFVVLVVGVNGSGKTTTIGKLAAIATAEGHSVLLAAGDTFRAAAVEQLGVWAQRAGARFLSRPTGADAAALAYDALKQAVEENIDIVFIDTAGRLQNRRELMDELAKIVRVMQKVIPEAPHATLLVLDATTGQNAMNQVEVFRQVAGVTGLVMTKLDGTARGGILAAIAERHAIPVHAIGVGEGLEDLQPFDAGAFAAAIAGLEEEKEPS